MSMQIGMSSGQQTNPGVITHTQVYKVKDGDCPWDIAKKTSKKFHTYRNKNNTPTNADIAKEMKRLAQLNGCSSAEEFTEKYFNKTGKDIKIIGSVHMPGAPIIHMPKFTPNGYVLAPCCDGKTSTKKYIDLE